MYRITTGDETTGLTVECETASEFSIALTFLGHAPNVTNEIFEAIKRAETT